VRAGPGLVPGIVKSRAGDDGWRGAVRVPASRSSRST